MHFSLRLALNIALFSFFVLLLSACGNKGPLYLPDNEAPPVSMTPITPPAAVTTKDASEQ